MASDSGNRGTACTLEFAVQMTCQNCVDAVHKSLQGVAGEDACVCLISWKSCPSPSNVTDATGDLKKQANETFVTNHRLLFLSVRCYRLPVAFLSFAFFELEEIRTAQRIVISAACYTGKQDLLREDKRGEPFPAWWLGTASQGVQSVEVQLENQMVLVETTLPSQDVQALLESTGRQAVLKGMGSGLLGNLGAAVAILEGPGPVQGVVRFLQLTPEHCLIEGTIDGLEPGPHGLHVHQFGDLTKNCNSCGDHFNPDGTSHGGPQDSDRHRGDLGNVHADADGRAIFRIEDEQLKVWDVIGRSLVIDEGEDDLGQGNHPLSKITGNSGVRLACGIIARSAGLFQNPKQICSCDGLTIWEERGRPIAGEGRKAQTPSHL